MAKRKNRKVTAEKSQNAGKHLKANRKYKEIGRASCRERV